MDAQIEDFLQILQLIRLRKPLNRLGGWAASADFMKTVFKELFLQLEKKSDITILECGSGVSTVLIGYFLQQYAPSAKLVTLDHDFNFYQKTYQELQLHQLDNIELLYAPLKPYELEGKVWLWYEIDGLKNLSNIDVLIVDGPPMATQKEARYPAVPLLISKLSEECVVLLDDAAREDERAIVQRWKMKFDFLEDYVQSQKGTSILHRWKLKQSPLVTIAIPTYNRLEYLKEAVASALNQTYDNVEILICDDGSHVDVKAELEKNFQDERVKILINEKNMGRPYTRNRLIDAAKGEYILWLDDDDILDKDTIKEYLKMKESIEEDIDIFYGNLKVFGEKESLFWPMDFYKNSQLLGYKLFSSSGSPIPNPFVMVKKEIYINFGKYDDEFTRAQDYELWARIWDAVTVKKVDKTVGQYRVHKNNVSAFGVLKADRSFESMAIRKNLTQEKLMKAFEGVSKENAISNFSKLLQEYFDYTNAYFYLSFIRKHEQMFTLALLIGDLNLLQSCNLNEQNAKVVKGYKKLLKLVQRGAISEELLLKLYKELQFSWLTLYANAIFYLNNNSEKAFEFARASLIANPYSKESRELMRRLGKEDEAKNVIERIVRSVNEFEKEKVQFFKERLGG